MAYEWTAEDPAELTPGCTVVHDGERREIVSVGCSDWSGKYTVSMRFEGQTFFLEDISPASVQHPTSVTLNRMAVEALGGQAFVSTLHGHVDVCTRDEFGRRCEWASFYGPESARECALWLAARRK